MVNLCLVGSGNEIRVENVPAPPSPEQPPMAPSDPPFPSPRGLRELESKQRIAVSIALQTHVLDTCPEHNEIFCDQEADPAAAFALAVDLIKRHAACVGEFGNDLHQLTDLLTTVIAAAATECPNCLDAAARQGPVWAEVIRPGRRPLHS